MATDHLPWLMGLCQHRGRCLNCRFGYPDVSCTSIYCRIYYHPISLVKTSRFETLAIRIDEDSESVRLVKFATDKATVKRLWSFL